MRRADRQPVLGLRPVRRMLHMHPLRAVCRARGSCMLAVRSVRRLLPVCTLHFVQRAQRHHMLALRVL